MFLHPMTIIGKKAVPTIPQKEKSQYNQKSFAFTIDRGRAIFPSNGFVPIINPL